VDNWSKGSLLAAAVALAALPAFAQMSLPGKFEVTDTGSASYTIPISVVSGTAGLEPKLSLQYDSRAGNGLLGVGWSLAGLPAITRCGKTIAQDGAVGGVNYDANDRFCLDGQRLIAINGGTYGADQTEYRTERESFSRVVSYGSAGSGPAWFKVWTKAGLVMEFGNTTDSRIEAQGKASARVWAINKTSDTKGNWFSVSYSEDNANGEYRPARIDYTGNGTTAPTNSVRFVYEVRPDIVPFYQAGSVIKTTQRMTKLQSWQGEDLVREKRLTYGSSTLTQRSFLATITDCADTCLATTSLSWLASAPAFGPKQKWTGAFGRVDGYNESTLPRMIADVNGDGRVDALGFASSGVYAATSTGAGFLIPAPLWNSCYVTSCGWSDTDTYPRDLADVNGDGHADLVGFASTGVSVSLSIGSGFASGSIWNGCYSTACGWAGNSIHPRQLVDVNGDGRADVVGFADSGVSVSLSTGSSFSNGSIWTAAFGRVSQGYTDDSVNPRMLADMNGDGLADMVGFSSQGVTVALSNGNQFQTPQIWTSSFASGPWGSMDVNPRLLADVNGDGLADVVGFNDTAIYVALSTGTGLLPVQAWKTGDMVRNSGWSTQQRYPRYLVDVNGDGMADVVGISAAGVVVALSTGSSFQVGQAWILGFGEDDGYVSANVHPRHIADANGDGMPDVIGFGVDGVYVAVSQARPELLTEVVTQAGGSMVVTFDPLSKGALLYGKDSGVTACAYPCVDIQGPMYVVSEVKSSNGLGGEYRSTYLSQHLSLCRCQG
jgi:hypothetical protein